MSLELDERQRAMLLEMGVRVWQAGTAVAPPQTAPQRVAQARPVDAPASAAVPQPALEVSAARAVVAPVRTVASPPLSTPAGLLPELQSMDWPALAQAVASCQACKLCTGRRAPVFGAAAADAPRRADWLIVGEPPDAAEEEAGAPFAEQAGQLLDNMLKALGLSRRGGSAATAAYVSNVVKCRPALARNPEPGELALCEHYLRHEVALLRPKVILALGRFAAQTLAQASLSAGSMPPLGKLRGQVFHYQSVPVVVSYHPAYLLRNQHDKARAWADWCLAASLLKQGDAPAA